MEEKLSYKRIAIVADWLTDRGGAEHVVEAMARAFPRATIFTSVYHRENFPALENREVKTTFLQKLPSFLRKKHQFLLPFFPMVFRSLDLSDYDVILTSSSSGFSKCVRKRREGQTHICYCHTPIRFLYHARDEYLTDYPLPWWMKPVKFLLPKLLDHLTRVDQTAAEQVDSFLSNSNFVGERIKTYYNRDSKTLYPCVNTEPFLKAAAQLPKKDYFLAVGRFIPYKKFDLLVETFIEKKLPLKLIGSGPELEKCKSLALSQGAENIEFLGFVNRALLPEIFAQARAFMFPVEEDFGLTPVEAMSAGTPVIYYNQGGATESVGKWGIPFAEQTVEGLKKGIEEFIEKENSFSRNELCERGKVFDEEVFIKKLQEYVKNIV